MCSRVVVDVLRQAGKACVVKRQFVRAELLIKAAVNIAKDALWDNSGKHADVLLDYGLYLLNIDNVSQSVRIYEVSDIIYTVNDLQINN